MLKRKRGAVRKTRTAAAFPALDLEPLTTGDLLDYWDVKGFRKTVRFVRKAKANAGIKRAVVEYYVTKTKTRGWKQMLVDARLLTLKEKME